MTKHSHLVRSALGIAVVALLAGVSACTSGSQTAQQTSGTSAVIPLLTVGTDLPEPTLDPTKNSGTSSVDNLALETLLNLGPDAQLEPNLATSVTQPNPVTYPDIVTVTLPGPDPAWKYTPALTFTGIFEARFAQAHGAAFGQPGALIMGTGPWEVDSLDPTTGAELSANPHWWGGRVPISHLSVKVFASQTSEALAFRAGEIDPASEITDAKSFAATSGAKLLTSPSCQDGFVTVNTQLPPWNDIHVRRAAAYAFNRADIIAAAGGYATPLYPHGVSATLKVVTFQQLEATATGPDAKRLTTTWSGGCINPDVSIALSSKFTDPGYNYWYFLDDDYDLGIKAAQ